jgi:undecaprenyl-diphosphatase
LTELDALILGFLQGATEFLPVSSSGHLVMGQELLGLSVPGLSFEVILHVATVLSVLLVYRERLRKLASEAADGRADARRYLGLLAVGTLPVAVVGVFFRDTVERLFDAPVTVGVALLFTGALLFTARWALRRPSAPELGFVTAFLIGVAQCVALVPGVSRSGSTVVAALWLGVSPLEAAAFSFLLSIPAIGGAAVLALPDVLSGASPVGPASLAVGFVAAAVTGVGAIRLFVRMLADGSFPRFAWYCWGVGTFFLTWLAFVAS